MSLILLNTKSTTPTIEVGSSFIVETASDKSSGWFAFHVPEVKGGPSLSSDSKKYFFPKRAKKRRPRWKMAKNAKAVKSKKWPKSVVSDTVLIEMWSSPGEAEWNSSPVLESPPSTRIEVIADKRKIGQASWRVADPSPKNFDEKLADWMQSIGLEPEPTTFRPAIVHSDRVKISEGGDVYHLPTLFYENVKKWMEEGGGGDRVKRLVPRSAFQGKEEINAWDEQSKLDQVVSFTLSSVRS